MVDSFAPKVFDGRAKRLQTQRARHSDPRHHFLHREVAERLADRLLDLEQSFQTIAVLGWWPDGIAHYLHPRLRTAWDRGELQLVDLSFDHGIAEADVEFLPLAQGRFDLILSNMALHWVNDLPGMLAQIRSALRPDGVFLGSALGGETLNELRAALVEAETDISGGFSPRVSPVMDLRDAAGLLQRAGFSLPVADIDRIMVSYQNPMSLLQDLRGMGQSNAVVGRTSRLTARSVLFGAIERYVAAFGDEQGSIPATFDCLFLSGWAPHTSQQKPLRPGSAEFRLAEALGVEERPLKS
ncbi:MAG: methyltransferase domain-containing protein [Rhodospirillaceae bacterium]|nr:MAG: methyltransferase domain-containing protein [Rhodospirillaceae bacterium]